MRGVLRAIVPDSGARSAKLVAGYIRTLEILSSTPNLEATAGSVLERVSEATGCESVALRLRDGRGEYPFFASRGFAEGFIAGEASLCRRDAQGLPARDESGRMVLQGICGAIIRGDLEGLSASLRESGMFWTGDLSESIASGGLTGDAMWGACAAQHHRTLALVPLRSGDRALGLLQVASQRGGELGEESLVFLEEVGARLTEAVRTYWRLRDAENAKEAYEEMQRRGDNLLAMGEVASRLAHELKNPLASMMLSITRLQRQAKGQEKLQSLAEHLRKSLSTLGETVTTVTGSVGKPEMVLGATDANSVLEEAVALIAPRAEEQGIDIRWETADRLPPVKADAKFLKRAILNLLVNALDVMPSSGVLRLATKLAPSGHVEIGIRDSGPGIDPHAAQELFKPYKTTKEDGTGMGLSVVKRVMEMHRGTAALGPAPEGGTEAILRLPAEEEV